MKTQIVKKTRYEMFDGIKGVAIVIVLLHHFAISFYQTILTGEPQLINTKLKWELFIHRTPLQIITQGGFAVLIFFMVSSYLLKRKINSNTEYLSQYKKIVYGRLIRLLPLAVVVILLGYLLMKLRLTYNVQVAEYSKSGSLRLLFPFGHVSLGLILRDFFSKLPWGPAPSYFNILWIIPYEIIGAWAVYLISILTRSEIIKRILYILLGFICIMANSYYVAFLFGMILADYKKPIKLNTSLSILLFITVCIFGSTTIESLNIYYYARFSIIFRSFAAMSFILLVMGNKKVHNLIKIRMLTYIGRNSYYYYLIHMLVLITLPCFIFLKLIPFVRYYQAVGVTFIAYIIMIPVAALGLRQIDKIFLWKS